MSWVPGRRVAVAVNPRSLTPLQDATARAILMTADGFTIARVAVGGKGPMRSEGAKRGQEFCGIRRRRGAGVQPTPLPLALRRRVGGVVAQVALGLGPVGQVGVEESLKDAAVVGGEQVDEFVDYD